jgi:hypothetical protein
MREADRKPFATGVCDRSVCIAVSRFCGKPPISPMLPRADTTLESSSPDEQKEKMGERSPRPAMKPDHDDPPDLAGHLRDVARRIDSGSLSLEEMAGFLKLLIELSANLSQQVSIVRERLDRLERWRAVVERGTAQR